MGYQVLARKWRPRNFHEVVGQQHVLTALINALDQERLHHAYLFSGTRGVGKTTIARILAKCLNCEQGVSSTPCGVCDSCREIDQGNFVDLLEIDAASRTKVEDTRELLDNVQYRPARGRYKVYLIDEVHMLSRHSFNALLKTLEEPPPYVKFLLATTDPQKLPITILSRCLQFHLKALNREQISGQLQTILDAEGQPYELPALGALAKAADGSMRDALSLTDQALAHGNGHVRLELVLAMLGTLDHRHLHQLLNLLAKQDGAALMAKVAELAQLGPDFDQVHLELAALLHRMALTQLLGAAPDPEALDAEQVVQLAGVFAADEIQLCYQMALQGRKELPLAPDGRSALEMTLLRMLAFSPRASVMSPQLTPVHQEQNPLPQPAALASGMPSMAAAVVNSVRTDRPSDHAASGTAAQQHQADEIAAAQIQHGLQQEQDALLAQAEYLRQSSPQGTTSEPVSAPEASSSAEPPASQAGLSNLLAARNRLRSQSAGAEPASRQAAVTPAQVMPVARPSSMTAMSASAPRRDTAPLPSAEPVAPATAESLDAHVAAPNSVPAIGNPRNAVDTPPWELPPLESYQDDMPMPSEPDRIEADGRVAAGSDMRAPMQAAARPMPASASSTVPIRGHSVSDASQDERWQSNDLLTGCGDAWAELIAASGLGGRLRQLALQSSRRIEADRWVLTLPEEHRHLVSDKAIAVMAQTLSEHVAQPVNLHIVLGQPEGKPPIVIEHERYQAILDQARTALDQDPHIQFLIERFGAQLDADSIQPLKTAN